MGMSQRLRAIKDYFEGSKGKDEFFDQDMYMVHVTHWPQEHLQPAEPVESSGDAHLALWQTHPRDDRSIPPPDDQGILFATSTFSLVNSGNRTARAPKRSWKINFEPGDDDDRLVGMSRLNLKAMYNDPSQMREALAWYLFDKVGVPSSRHTYAKLAINDRYMGLFSLIEQVDRRFLKDHFGKNDRGNLYKAYCGDIGCATLEHRVGNDGDDVGISTSQWGARTRPIASRQMRTMGQPTLMTTSLASSGSSTESGSLGATTGSIPMLSESRWRTF